MKSLSALIFLLACVGWTRADPWQNDLDKAFNQDFAPCNDFYNHVCDYNSSAIVHFARYQGHYLVKDIAKLLPTDDDVVIRRVTEALRKLRNSRDASLSSDELDRRLYDCQTKGLKGDQSHTNQYETGKTFGELTAYGRADPYYIRCASKYSCEIDSYFVSDNPREKGMHSESPDFYRGIFDGYFETLNITVDHDFFITYPEILPTVPYAVFDTRLEDATNKASLLKLDEMSVEDRHVFLAAKDSRTTFQDLSSYLNVLYSQTMYAHPEKFHPELFDEFELLVTKIVDEICEAIESSDWMTLKARRRLARQVRRLKIEIAIPKHHRDLKHLTELLEVYHRAVANVPDMDESGCEYEMIVRAITVTKNRLIHMRNEKGTIDFHGWGLSKMKFDDHLFAVGNGMQREDTAFIWPPSIYFLSGNYSLGFKYGYAGMIIGHEIFHFLGLDDISKRPHLARIMETPHYSEMRECYYDYYGRITCADDGKECPDGKLKASEGYCDVEGNRVVHRVLMKALNQSRYTNRAKRNAKVDEFPLFGSKPILSRKGDRLLKDSDLLDVDVNEERKWHFYAYQLFFCRRPEISGERNVTETMFDSEHPRSGVRVHAALKQMKEFSEAFQCKKGDRNYALHDDEICEAYPLLTTTTALLVTTTTEIPSTTRSTKNTAEERTEKEISSSSSSPPMKATNFPETPSASVEEMEQLKRSGADVAAQFVTYMVAVLVILWV